MTIKEAYEAMKDGSKVFWTWTMPDGHLSIGRGVITGIGPSSVSLSSDGLSAGDASDSVPLRMVSFVTKDLPGCSSNEKEIKDKIASLERENKIDEAGREHVKALLSALRTLKDFIFSKKHENANSKSAKNEVPDMIGNTVFWLYDKESLNDLEGNCISSFLPPESISLGCGTLEWASDDGRGTVSGFSFGLDGSSPLLSKLALDPLNIVNPLVIPEGQMEKIKKDIDGAIDDSESTIKEYSDMISARKDIIIRLNSDLF